MKLLHTTLGPMRADELGPILPHEHVFVDLRTPDQPGYAEADPAEVVRLMAPRARGAEGARLHSASSNAPRAALACASISISPSSKATGFPIVVPTGNYREPWIPDWVRDASEAELEARMYRDLSEGVGDTGVKAAWIKVSAGDDGITPLEARILRAAARAAQRTGAVIGSHTIKGRVVLDQLDIIEAEGYRADRFISIHTQEEKDFGLNIAVAQRGAWIEYDHVGREPDDEVAALILKALEAGKANQLLISHDLGWYDPALPGGGTPRGYTHLADVMLPLLQRRVSTMPPSAS
jgi:phosphotriesterase-related protein